MAKYPEITIKKVNTSSGGDDPRSGIKTSLLAGDQYDLLLNTWPSLEAELRDSGMLVPVDEYWDKYGWEKYLNDSWRNLAGADGKTWAVYFIAGNRSGMWYSKETMKKADITKEPETWAEFKEMCSKIKKAGITPLAVGARSWAQTEWFENILLKVGGTEAAAKLAGREIPWDSDVVVETLKAWQELLQAGFFDDPKVMFSGSWDAAVDAALHNKTAGLTLMGSWVNGHAAGTYNLKPGEDFTFMPFPVIKDKYAKAMSIDGKSWVMMAGGKNPEAAALYLDFMAGPEGAAILAKYNLMTPSSEAPLDLYDPVSRKSAGLLAGSDVFFVLDDMLPAEMSAEFRSGLQTFLADPSDSTISKVVKAWEAKAETLY